MNVTEARPYHAALGNCSELRAEGRKSRRETRSTPVGEPDPGERRPIKFLLFSLGQVDKLDPPWKRPQIEARDRDRQLKTPRPGTPWVQVSDAIPFSVARLVRVPADNHFELSRNGIKVQLRKIMKDVDLGRTSLGDCRQRQLGRPSALIDVPSALSPFPTS